MAKQRGTHRPTGMPSWPILLIAGAEGSGKTYACAKASGSELVGRTLWLVVGEDEPNEYRDVPGADFEIVEHDGTYRDLVDAAKWATAQPKTDGRPNLLILDSFGRVWDLLAEMAQAEANRRRNDRNGEARIASDLWNLAASRWHKLFNVLREHDGPVIVTAKLERQTVFTESGDPTKEKQNKVKAQKGLASDVGAVVELHGLDEAYLAKVRTLRPHPAPTDKLPGFDVAEFWRTLGLADDAAARQHTATVVADGEDSADDARAELLALCNVHNVSPGAILTRYRETHDADLRTEEDAATIRAFTAEQFAAEPATPAAP